MSEHRYGSDCSCPDCRIADLREQLAAVTAERDEARQEVADWLEVYPRINKNMLAMGQMRDAAIKERDEAVANMQILRDVNQNWATSWEALNDENTRLEDEQDTAEAQTAYADETVRQTQEAMDAWRARAEAAERRGISLARRLRDARVKMNTLTNDAFKCRMAARVTLAMKKRAEAAARVVEAARRHTEWSRGQDESQIVVSADSYQWLREALAQYDAAWKGGATSAETCADAEPGQVMVWCECGKMRPVLAKHGARKGGA